MNKNKLKKILNALSEPSEEFKSFDESVSKLKSELKDKVHAKTLEDVNRQLDLFRRKIDLTPLTEAVSGLETSTHERIREVAELIAQEVQNLATLSESTRKRDASERTLIVQNIKALKERLYSLSEEKNAELRELGEKVRNLQSFAKESENTITALQKSLEAVEDDHSEMELAMEVTDEIERLRNELNARINNLVPEGRGGNANRQINVKSSLMSTKYTDINFANSTSIGWTATNDDVFKRVNITASILMGAGGSGTPGGNDTEVQFNDGGAFGASSVFTFNKNSSIVAIANGLVVNGDGSSNNTRPVDIVNTTTTNALRITTTSSVAASRSVGGQLLVSNGTTNTGNAAVFYSNVASALGRIVHITADNPSFDKEALYVESDSTSTTTVGVIGRSSTQGTIKVTHVGTGGDADAAVLSLDAQGSGTAAQGIFLDATTAGGTTGKLLNLRNDGVERMVLGATGAASILGNVVLGRTGSVFGALDLMGTTSGTVRIQPASAAGNWTLTLPPNDGSANQVLTTDGNGIAVWASVAAVGGSGIQRVTSIITADTTAGDTASRDYMFFIEEGLRFTLPTAVSNTNLYTIKNMAASSVLVLTSAGETIDGSATVLLPTQYESLSFQSNNSVWGVV